ncbi:MAG: Tad domain-containing protein [Terracidiphilus sp.]|nr:Tad domain-containing protein [Terracidiphilus sp.]
MRFHDEDGQMLVITAVSLIGLMGFVALAVDVGLLFRARRNMQIAADAGAMAGATQLFYGPNSTAQVRAAARAAATLNGVDYSVSGNSVLVDVPPVDGPNTGCASCVEVRVGSPAQTFFAGLITGGNSMTVAARAVAGAPSVSNACIWIMEPNASDVLHLQGNSNIDAPGCSIYVNSNNSGAVKVTGNSNNYNGPEFGVVGGYSGHNTSPTGITIGVAVQTPPISSLGNPSSCYSDTTTKTISSTYTPPSGSTAVCFTNAITLSNGAILSGAVGDGIVYQFGNGVTVSTGATVSIGTYTGTPPTSGGTYDPAKTYSAVVDLAGGTLNQNSNSVLNAYAPTSGTYNGVAIMQPTSNPTTPLQVQFGSNNEYLDGIIYAPGTQVYLQDNGGGVTATGVIAATMFIKTSTLTIPNYSDANPTTTPFRKLTMLE